MDFIPVSGYYEDTVLIHPSSKTSSLTFNYLNGFTIDSFRVFDQTITVTNNQENGYRFSIIPTTIDTNNPLIPHIPRWRAPKQFAPSAQIYRFKNEDQAIIKTYFIGKDFKANKTPVVSIVMDSMDLFDYNNGIMIPGRTLDPNNPRRTGNYKQKDNDWKRSAHFEYFDNNLQLQYKKQLSIKLQGEYIRLLPQKSFKIYGMDTMQFPFFGEDGPYSFEGINLRLTQDYYAHNLVNEMIKPLNCSHYHFQTVKLYLNGEFWGMYNMRERVSDSFLKKQFKIEKEKFNLIANYNTAKSGNLESFRTLFNELEQTDASNILPFIKQHFILNEFIDYIIIETYFGNTDWPGNNFLAIEDDSNKWHLILDDLDHCFKHRHKDILQTILATENLSWVNPLQSTLLYRKAFSSDAFKTQFMLRYKDFENEILDEDRLLSEHDKIFNSYKSLIADQLNRWNIPSSSLEWEQYYIGVNDFIRKRSSIYRQQLKQHFPVHYHLTE